MKELSIEEKAKRYDKALKVLHKYDGANIMFTQDLKEEMFPELKESEDEKIRKRIIDALHGDVLEMSEIKDATTWLEKKGNLMKALQISNARIGELIEKNYYLKEQLEKQGEHANFLSKIQVGDKVTRNEDGVLVNLSQLNRVAKKDEKQGEQKPVEPKFPHYKSIVDKVFDAGNLESLEYEEAEMLVALAKEELLKDIQKPVEWRPSKEVMDVLYSLCYITNVIDDHKDAVLIKLYQDLKREFFNSVSYENMFSKEEKIKLSLAKWNEEDDMKLRAAIDLVGYTCETWSREYRTEFIDWLKSLKDRYTWKPSDEQMKALEHFVRSIGESGYASPYDNDTKLLYSLLFDLKKLREK